MDQETRLANFRYKGIGFIDTALQSPIIFSNCTWNNWANAPKVHDIVGLHSKKIIDMRKSSYFAVLDSALHLFCKHSIYVHSQAAPQFWPNHQYEFWVLWHSIQFWTSTNRHQSHLFLSGCRSCTIAAAQPRRPNDRATHSTHYRGIKRQNLAP